MQALISLKYVMASGTLQDILFSVGKVMLH